MVRARTVASKKPSLTDWHINYTALHMQGSVVDANDIRKTLIFLSFIAIVLGKGDFL